MSEDGLHAAAGATPLFILSFRQRDELASLAGGAGWQVVAARRAGGVERRFLASGAAVAVVDARGALADGLEGARQLGPAIEANGGAMLVLVSRGDQDAIAALYEAGATHFLSSPSSEAEFLQALRYAARHAMRMAGEWRASASAEPLGWRLDLAERTVLLTPAFARLLGVDEQPGLAQMLRRIEPRERPAALAALRRITAEKPATAFAHDLSGIGRVVQHLHLDAAGARVDAIVEPLG
ncbi:ANTAR domain-containing protein, partial [Sphingomonas immobilis]|nr:GGDEF domain-containing protein [Sphingomonas sp. CA1-15]